ncbi:MAG: NAD-dependent epimerase/dehydratase family protein [Chitinophagaceae bacterium]|nr:NAD-dependent epimerase/dehydratase family protein [Chitinophagaceae bacterium]
MKIYILGNGLIGATLADQLSVAGHEVTVISRTASGQKGSIRYLSHELKDIAGDASLLSGADLLVHAMSSSSPASSMNNIWQDAYDQILLNIQLFETLSSLQSKKIVFISSGGAVYGHPLNEKVDENHPTDPVSAYGVGKLSAEKYLQLFGYQRGLDYLILRPSNVYGFIESIRKPQGVISYLLNSALNDKPFQLWGSLDNHKDYLYVEDLADAISQVIKKPGQLGGRCYNISYGVLSSLGQIIHIIESITGKTIHLNQGEEARFDVSNIEVDSSLFKKDFNWQPKTGIEQGISLIFEKHLQQP